MTAMKHTAKRGSERKDVQVNLRLDWALAQQLEDAVHGKDVTQSQIMRRALREFFERLKAGVAA